MPGAVLLLLPAAAAVVPCKCVLHVLLRWVVYCSPREPHLTRINSLLLFLIRMMLLGTKFPALYGHPYG